MGLGGATVEVTFGDVWIAIDDASSRVSFRTEIGFHTADDESLAILGHAGFLEYFTATFDGAAVELTLRPNANLPLG